MIAFRKFIFALSGFYLVFLCLNAYIWHFHTQKILVRDGQLFVGDLARVGYLPDHAQPRPNSFDLPKRHLELSQYAGETVDLITLGDSFSNGLGFGPNRYYQDYIATDFDLKVLNLPPLTSLRGLMNDAVALAQSGYLQKTGAKFLLLQMAERNCLSRLNGTLLLDQQVGLDDVEKTYSVEANNKQFSEALPEVRFINTGNLKFLVNAVGYLFSDKAVYGGLYKTRLEKKMFDHELGASLLFIDKDIRKLKLESDENLEKINDNLNRLADLLRSVGVELIFLPAPNKYTIYRPYIADESYPVGRFFETMRAFNKRYTFVDTEAILRKEVERGVLDVYYIDDTHWSEKASQAIVHQIDFPTLLPTSSASRAEAPDS